MPSFWCQNIFKNVRVLSVALDTSDSVSGASFSSGWNLFCISVCATMIRESVVPIFSPFKLAARFLGCRVVAEESGLAVSGAVISTLKKCDVARNLWTSCGGEFPRAVSCFLKLKSLQLFSYIIFRVSYVRRINRWQWRRRRIDVNNAGLLSSFSSVCLCFRVIC